MKKFMIILLASCICIVTVACQENVKPKENIEAVKEETSEILIYNVGDVIKIGDLRFIVESVRTSKGGESKAPNEGNKYLYIMITAENTGSETDLVSEATSFRLFDSEGMTYDTANPNDKKGEIRGELGGGKKIKGEIVYEVPENINEFELEINPDCVNIGMATVKIKSE